MRDGLGVQRVVDRDPSFECLAELSSVRREHIEGSGDWRRDECGAQLGSAFEAQRQRIPRDSNVVETRLLQKLPKVVGVRHTPRSAAIALGELVARYFPDGALEGGERRRLLDLRPHRDSHPAACPQRAAHLRQRGRPIREELQPLLTDHKVEVGIRDRQSISRRLGPRPYAGCVTSTT